MTRDEFDQVRVALGFTLEQIATLTGYKLNAVKRWSAGYDDVPAPGVQMLNLALGRVTVLEILVSVRSMVPPVDPGKPRGKPRGRPFTRADGLEAMKKLRARRAASRPEGGEG